MRHFFTALAFASVIAGASAETIPLTVVGSPKHDKELSSVVRERSFNAPKAIAKAPGVEFSIEFVLNETKGQYVFVCFAVPSEGLAGGRYEAQKTSDTSYALQLPAGSYDFMAIIRDDDAEERTILVKEDVEVSAGMDAVMFDTSTATASTRIRHTDSNGNQLILPSYTLQSNCTTGDFLDLVMHNGELVWAGETLAYMECNYILLTNQAESRFETIRMDMVGAESEVTAYVIPVDFSKEVCGPTSAEGWQVSEQSFATTPFMAASHQYDLESMGEPYYFTFVCRGVLLNGNWWGKSGIGIFDMPCNSGRVAIWAPADYDGPFQPTLSPSSNVFSGDDSSVQALPLMRGEDGLVQLGYNFASGNKFTTFAFTADSKNVMNGYSRFSGVPAPGQRANCTPLFFGCTDFSGFYYTYKGRYGEDMSLDSYDVMRSLGDEELMEILGGQPSDIEIYSGDKLVCSSRNELSYGVNWVAGAENKAIVTMRNVLIDETIPGCNTATVCWNASKGNGFAPTFTSLQFRNTADEIGDRFVNAADGVVEFTVGDLAVEYSDVLEGLYCEVGEVKTVKAEYAPHGSNEFSAIDVTEDSSLFFDPGYGYFFRGSLACVDRKATDGWFDLRLTATDADGASIEQVIAPAFRIESLVGVNGIAADSQFDYKVVGNSIVVADGMRILSVDGSACDGRNLTPGVYVVTDGTHSEKVMIGR